MSPRAKTQKPRKSNSQLTIWKLTKKKPEQQEIWDIINKKIKAEGKPLKKKPIEYQKPRLATKFYTIDDEIKRLSQELANIQKSLNPRYPAENDYKNRKIVEIKAKLKVLGTYKKMINKAGNPDNELRAITKTINEKIQSLFRSFKKRYNNANISKAEADILNNLNEISNKILSEKINTEDIRFLFLDFTNNIRKLHTTIYSKHVSRAPIIKEINRILDSVFGE